MGGPPQMQHRPQQAMQGQFPPVSGPSPSRQGPCYPQMTVYPIGQPSPPVYVVRAPTASMTGMPQFETQNFEPLALERKIIQIKDAEQSASSRTSPLPLQHQAEANREAQFASIKFTPLVAGALALLGSLYFSSAGVGSAVARQATMSPIDTHRTGLY